MSSHRIYYNCHLPHVTNLHDKNVFSIVALTLAGLPPLAGFKLLLSTDRSKRIPIFDLSMLLLRGIIC